MDNNNPACVIEDGYCIHCLCGIARAAAASSAMHMFATGATRTPLGEGSYSILRMNADILVLKRMAKRGRRIHDVASFYELWKTEFAVNASTYSDHAKEAADHPLKNLYLYDYRQARARPDGRIKSYIDHMYTMFLTGIHGQLTIVHGHFPFKPDLPWNGSLVADFRN